MWILTHSFFSETFQQMNAALTFQIGLNDCARAIRGKITFARAWESFQRNADKVYGISFKYVRYLKEYGSFHFYS